MTQRLQRDYFNAKTAEVSQYAESLREQAAPSGTFDSAAAADFNADTSVKVPEKLQTVLDEAGDGATKIQKAILDGIGIYEQAHGVNVPADVVEQAIHAAYTNTADVRKRIMLDSATSLHHDQLSLQPNRAVVSILSIFAEAIPFAHYLPADIGSNEAKLAIMSHKAGSKFGGYEQNALMDGIYSGESYVSAARTHTMVADGTADPLTGKITAIQTDGDHCDPNGGDLKLLRGRTVVYVNGRVAAREVANTSGAGNSPISGTVVLGGTAFSISGTVNTDTGAISLTSTPSLPNGASVAVTGFIDFEAAPNLTPTVISAVQTYPLYANPWRVKARHSIDSRHQMANELGLDPYGESVIAIQGQFSNERHYDALRKGRRLAVANTETFDLNYAGRQTDLVRAQMWQDFAYPLASVSTQMAINTMSYGVSHLYVTKRVAAQLMSLPSTMFQPSGLSPRAGIYRLGRLFGQYDVYFTPKGLSETTTSSQVLCIGRAHDVARNPIVLGDAVPPTVLPLAIGDDMSNGAGFYARNFTEVNPHAESSMGFAMIEITGM
ncbi:MAG TPA: hypothetical protein VIG97_02155 [Luteimonas sp.]